MTVDTVIFADTDVRMETGTGQMYQAGTWQMGITGFETGMVGRSWRLTNEDILRVSNPYENDTDVTLTDTTMEVYQAGEWRTDTKPSDTTEFHIKTVSPSIRWITDTHPMDADSGGSVGRTYTLTPQHDTSAIGGVSPNLVFVTDSKAMTITDTHPSDRDSGVSVGRTWTSTALHDTSAIGGVAPNLVFVTDSKAMTITDTHPSDRDSGVSVGRTWQTTVQHDTGAIGGVAPNLVFVTDSKAITITDTHPADGDSGVSVGRTWNTREDQDTIKVSSIFITKTETYAATGAQDTMRVSDKPTQSYSVQVKGTGAAATTWDVRLEGSLDSLNFTQILQHTNTTGDGNVLFSGSSDSPALYLRIRVAGLTLGLATNIIVTALAVQ